MSRAGGRGQVRLLGQHHRCRAGQHRPDDDLQPGDVVGRQARAPTAPGRRGGPGSRSRRRSRPPRDRATSFGSPVEPEVRTVRGAGSRLGQPALEQIAQVVGLACRADAAIAGGSIRPAYRPGSAGVARLGPAGHLPHWSPRWLLQLSGSKVPVLERFRLPSHRCWRAPGSRWLRTPSCGGRRCLHSLSRWRSRSASTTPTTTPTGSGAPTPTGSVRSDWSGPARRRLVW